LDFVDNRIDPGTGMIKVRGIIDEPNNPLVPGLFVRVRVTTGAPRPMMFVAERALGIDQGQRFVYLVDSENKVQYKAVKASAGQGGLRRLDTELPAESWVVVNGLQRARPGIIVAPQRAKMTDFVTTSAAAPAPITSPSGEASTPDAGKAASAEDSSGR
jgi:multidrug efflux pump subunit AcrA (membrane-fusion protein)